MWRRFLTQVTRLVRLLLLIVIALDAVLLGWLVYSAYSLKDWVIGVLVSILMVSKSPKVIANCRCSYPSDDSPVLGVVLVFVAGA